MKLIQDDWIRPSPIVLYQFQVSRNFCSINKFIFITFSKFREIRIFLIAINYIMWYVPEELVPLWPFQLMVEQIFHNRPPNCSEHLWHLQNFHKVHDIWICQKVPQYSCCLISIQIQNIEGHFCLYFLWGCKPVK